MPSMPGVPFFQRTYVKARCRFARSSTWANSAWRRIDSGYADHPATSSSCGSAAACWRRWSDAFPPLFVTIRCLSSFGLSAVASPTMWRLLHGIQQPLPDAQLRCSEAPGRCPEVSYGLGLHPLAELASFQRPRATQFAPGNPASTLQTPPRDDTLALLLAFGSAQPSRRIYSDEVNAPCHGAHRGSSGVRSRLAGETSLWSGRLDDVEK